MRRHRVMPQHAMVAGALTLTLLAAGCSVSTLNRSESLNPSAFTETGSDVARTFEEATLVLPGGPGLPPVVGPRDDDAVSRRLSEIEDERPLPTVMYLHGCTGLDNLEPLRELARSGFAVIAPNSFARRFRPLQCRPSRRTGGDNVFVYDFRLTEISYAVHRLAEAQWVDHERLFLFGVSEGGVAVALYRGDEFRARVIAQWTCHGNPFIRGLAAPVDEPILAVVRDNDPWYTPVQQHNQRGDCGAFFNGRPGSQSLVLHDGQSHDVLDDALVRTRILEFLRSALRSPEAPDGRLLGPGQNAAALGAD